MIKNNRYRLEQAIKIMKDANKKYKNGNYGIAIYSAYLAKTYFEEYQSEDGVSFCSDLINLSTAGLRKELERDAFNQLISEGVKEPTQELIRSKIRTSATICSLSDSLEKFVGSSLEGLIDLFGRLIHGNRGDPGTDFIFAYNRSN